MCPSLVSFVGGHSQPPGRRACWREAREARNHSKGPEHKEGQKAPSYRIPGPAWPQGNGLSPWETWEGYRPLSEALQLPSSLDTQHATEMSLLKMTALSLLHIEADVVKQKQGSCLSTGLVSSRRWGALISAECHVPGAPCQALRTAVSKAQT